MDVKEAVRVAKDYVVSTFADEQPAEVGLEEFDRERGRWLITIGFTRRFVDTIVEAPRTYKIVEIDDRTGAVRSIRHRELLS